MIWGGDDIRIIGDIIIASLMVSGLRRLAAMAVTGRRTIHPPVLFPLRTIHESRRID